MKNNIKISYQRLNSILKSLKLFSFSFLFILGFPLYSSSAGNLIDSAQTSFQNQEYKKALEYCDEISKQDSLDHELLYIRGFSTYMLSMYDSAVIDFTSLLRLNQIMANPSTVVLILEARGYSFLKLQEYESAISDFSESIQMDSTNWETFYKRGLAYVSKDDYEHAIEDIDQALKLINSIPDMQEVGDRVQGVRDQLNLMQNKAKFKSENLWQSPALLKIFGIFAMVLLVVIIKMVKESKANSQNERLNKLLNRVPKSEFKIDKDELVDKFFISTYEGLWQDFRNPKWYKDTAEELTVELNKKTIVFSYRECEASLNYNQIDKITLFTKGRGRYDGIIDTYLKLDFDYKKLLVTVQNEHYSEFLQQIGRIRIRKSNAPLKGEFYNLDFERTIEQILKDLGD